MISWINGETERYPPGQGLEVRECVRPEAGGTDPSQRGRGSQKVLVAHSVRLQRMEVSGGPARGPPEQLYSWLVRDFVIYYTKSKETTWAFIVGTKTTWVAQKQVRKSWPQRGQEKSERDVPAVDVPEIKNPQDYRPLGGSSQSPKPRYWYSRSPTRPQGRTKEP